MLGVRIAPHKTILVPTAHDEPAIHLEIYKELFSLPAGLAYNTEVERRFLTTHFSIRAIEEETIGCGVDLPQAQDYPREAAGFGRTRTIRRPRTSRWTTAPRRSVRTWRSAARCSAGGTACTGRSRSTAAASIPARAARS